MTAAQSLRGIVVRGVRPRPPVTATTGAAPVAGRPRSAPVVGSYAGVTSPPATRSRDWLSERAAAHGRGEPGPVRHGALFHRGGRRRPALVRRALASVPTETWNGTNCRQVNEMDTYLVDYLRSGKAWVLVGSGPSAAMGYPSWRDLAISARDAARVEGSGHNQAALEQALEDSDYPLAFEQAKHGLGIARLRQILQERLRPTSAGRVYQILASWPIPVYLTTNFDDELQTHLTQLDESYLSYTNSEDHFAHLIPEARGLICKLHGDLRSKAGLVLTQADYNAISSGDNFRYWRTKMTSVCQMNRLVVVGHSLTDPHMQHVLEAAKEGAGVLQPVCWIAPDVPPDIAREFLEKWRVRVLSYDNRQGDHRNLVRLMEHLDDFTPPRTSITIGNAIAAVTESGSGPNAAAPGFFVFNKLHSHDDFEDKRIDVVLAAVQATIPHFESRTFELTEPLDKVGWPSTVPLPDELKNQIVTRGLELGILKSDGDKFTFTGEASKEYLERAAAFEHIRDRFHLSLVLRLKRDFALDDTTCDVIATDIEASLTGYFREGGLTLASLLLSTPQTNHQSKVPKSIIKFLTQSSARYSDQLHRQAFCHVSLDAFVRAGDAERSYLGRVSQGFLGFHMLGAFGSAAAERLRNARDTVWLLDSNVQIPSIAPGADAYPVFRGCLERLHSLGLRFFSTAALADETGRHLSRYADEVIGQYGETSRRRFWRWRQGSHRSGAAMWPPDFSTVL